MGTTPTPPFAFSTDAKDLNRLVNAWFCNYACGQPDSQSLVECVNRIAGAYGVICGAVGVIDSQTNRFNHLSHYPGDRPKARKQVLFPILAPTNVDEARKLRIKSANFDTWLRHIFDFQRRNQAASGNQRASQTPDDLGTLPKLIVLPSIIRTYLQQWLDILAITAFLHLKKAVSVETLLKRPFGSLAEVFSQQSHWSTDQDFVAFERATSVCACLSSVADVLESEKARVPSVECLFFGREQKLYNKKDKQALAVLRSYLDCLTVEHVRTQLGVTTRYDVGPLVQDGVRSALSGLHQQAQVPLVPYLLINRFYNMPVCHIVWPFFKTLSYHPGTDVPTFAFPGRLYIAVSVEDAWTDDDIAARLYPFFLLMKVAMEPFVDIEYFASIERPRIRLEEKRYAFMATSHELKKLVGLIPLCSGKPFLLEALRNYLLTISLPAADALDEIGDGPLLAKAVRGLDSSGTPCPNYERWLIELTTLACEIHIVATLARQQVIETPDQLASWIEELASDVIVSPELATFTIPRQFHVRCYLAVAILCAIRNVLHHCSEPDVERQSGATPRVTWIRRAANAIRIGVETVSDGPAVVIRNPSDNRGIPDPESGSLLAMNFFLVQIDPKRRGTNELKDGGYVCRLPLHTDGGV